jgi:hypothetical protein
MKNLQEKETFLRTLFHPKIDRVGQLLNAKNQPVFEDAFTLIKTSLRHPVAKRFITTFPFPKTFYELRKISIIPTSKTLSGEIAWNLVPILAEKDKINSWLELKVELEDQILLGLYNQGNDTLEKIRTEFGVSVWYLHNKLLLAELTGGTENNWLAKTDLADKMDDGLLLYFTEHYSKSVEEKSTYSRSVDILVNEINELDADQAFKEYLLYRINYLSVKTYHHYANFLNFESSASLIDRYLVLRQILVDIAETKHKKLFENILLKTRELKDSIFTQLSNHLEITSFQTLAHTYNVLDIIDLYTTGKYIECLKMIPLILKSSPQIIELYDIYARSNIEKTKEFIKPHVSPLVDKIIENLFHLYVRNSDSNKSVESLLKIIANNLSADWARQLLSITNTVFELNGPNSTYDNYYYYYSKINNPKALNEFSVILNSNNLIGLLSDNLPHSCIRLLNAIEIGDDAFINAIDEIPIAKKRLYLIRSKFKNRKYDEVIYLGDSIINDNKCSPYVLEEAIILVFNSLLALSQTKDALILFVSTYLSNPNLGNRLNQEELLTLLNENLQLVEKSIEYPIFLSIHFTEAYDKYVGYDNFLSALNLEKPSGLLSEKNKYDNEKFIYFLRHVCDLEVLKYSYHFINKEDVESERLLILDELRKADKKNETLYIKEITTITKNAAINKALREVNKGKITINVEPLKETESNNIKEGFKRYEELTNFSKQNKIQGIDLSGRQITEYFNQLTEDNKPKIVYINDPAFISFKLMFLEIRDKFILSKEYGLDGYLSTRIRHGTFQNYIRSVFESENLISQKDANGDYLDLEYWQAKLTNYPDELIEIQKLIHKFSKEIDDYTEYVIKELFQVKTEKYFKKPAALFDYSFSQLELAGYFTLIKEEQIKDHQAFLDLIFDILIEKTDLILKEIRQLILFGVTNSYMKIIESFQDEIKNIIEAIFIPELTHSIMRCSTNLRRELTTISEWFYIANPTSDLYLDINTILQTSIQITNRIYPYKKIEPTVHLSIPHDLTESLHLIYITRILLDNIIEHSKLSAHELRINIDGQITSDDCLALKFTNNLASYVSLPSIKFALETAKAKWRESEQDYTKTDIEGGSGFDKIRRILTFDMRVKKHYFDYEISDHLVSVIIGISIDDVL